MDIEKIALNALNKRAKKSKRYNLTQEAINKLAEIAELYGVNESNLLDEIILNLTCGDKNGK